ncbi:hypothetical protein CDD82_174 [Ophiocordyceps australis]|uniref:ER transporter 6TM N-terminal domain-containing protein n=1 Tax=Ophiocordyceps australis TaxID=1399860 RepID=A0A2C5ZNV5_9HYPO|nr:hypothetical protein CDD82_174 [Ophiocordyceps australis]
MDKSPASKTHSDYMLGTLGPSSPGSCDDDDAMSGQDDGQTARSSKWRRRVPACVASHLNWHDQKIFVRCVMAIWVATILVFINPVLRSLGAATFFGALLLFICPPTSIFSIYLLMALSLLLGMSVGWAWGLLTMKAALAARPAHETQAKFDALKQQAAVRANQTGRSVAYEAEILVHDGFMLDARVTVVFFVMAAIFVYVTSRLRCVNPKFKQFQLFGIIVLDIFTLTGPTVPSFTPTLPKGLVAPGAIGMGLGTLSCLVMFPQSTSYVVLGSMQKIVLMTSKSLHYTRARLAAQDLSVAELKATRNSMVAVYKAMQSALTFLPLDVSRGRWNTDDVTALQSPLRKLMLASGSLIDFVINSIQNMERVSASQDDESEKTVHHDDPHRQQSAGFLDALRSPEQAAARANTLDALHQTTGPLLETCSNSIELIAKCINVVNTRRWLNQPSNDTFADLSRQLRDSLQTLRATRDRCITETTEAILDTHKHLFDDSGHLMLIKGQPPKLPGIVISMVLEERILAMTNAVDKFLQEVLYLSETRTVHRIWFPSRLRYALSWLASGKAPESESVNVDDSGSTTNPDLDSDSGSATGSVQDQAKEARRQLRLVRGRHGIPPTRSKLSKALVATYVWLTNPSGLYALRMTVVTMVTCIPAVIPHTAGFYFREKGIWGVITAQTTLLVYMPDFTLALVSRFLGTVIGGVLGTVAWYIGAGNGPGNPYGLAAISAVMIAIMVWTRIFLPPSMIVATIMAGTTFELVIGFSYDEDHNPGYGLPGKGYEAFWKRLVVVMCGLLASLLVQMFPKPPSATTHVRKTLANTVRTLADHYALVLSHWGREEGSSPLGAVAEDLDVEVSEKLLTLSAPISVLKIELTFGPFDQANLRATQEQCYSMNHALGRLLALSASLPKEMQQRLIFTAGILDRAVIGDNMGVLGLIEQTLRTGYPLPDMLPTPLVQRFFETWQADKRASMLTVALVRDDNYRRYCVALSSYVKFLATIDELVVILKGGVGVSHVVQAELV